MAMAVMDKSPTPSKSPTLCGVKINSPPLSPGGKLLIIPFCYPSGKTHVPPRSLSKGVTGGGKEKQTALSEGCHESVEPLHHRTEYEYKNSLVS